MTDHPIIVPVEELKKLWREQAPLVGREEWLIERAAQWGCVQRGEVNEAKLQQARDQELEACCEWLRHEYGYFEEGADLADNLRSARRPKPPSLKEQALADFNWLVGRTLGRAEFDERSNRIQRALESLPDD